MSQPFNHNSNDYFNNNIQNFYPHSQPINNNINQILGNLFNNQNNNSKEKEKNIDNDFIYEIIFYAISNIYNSDKTNDIKIKIIRIITKIIENILEAENKNEDSEKFRKIKISNPNISLMFDINGNYEFIKVLGFQEQFIGEDLCLYLPKKSINIPLFQKSLSYIELLLLNFQENEESKRNYYESNEYKKGNNITPIYRYNNNIGKYEQNNNNVNIINDYEDNKINYNNQNNKDIRQILKETRNVRLGNKNVDMEYGDNWNMKPQGPSREGARILRETGRERYQNALLYSNNHNYNGNNWNMKNNFNNFKPNIHTFDDFEKLDIRVGTIIEATNFEKAKRPAYKLKIDFGEEIGIKNSSAQITDVYDPEELVGKQVLAVVNFPKKQIADFMSEVLVLGTYSKDGVVLITPDKKVTNGDKLG